MLCISCKLLFALVFLSRNECCIDFPLHFGNCPFPRIFVWQLHITRSEKFCRRRKRYIHLSIWTWRFKLDFIYPVEAMRAMLVFHIRAKTNGSTMQNCRRKPRHWLRTDRCLRCTTVQMFDQSVWTTSNMLMSRCGIHAMRI